MRRDRIKGRQREPVPKIGAFQITIRIQTVHLDPAYQWQDIRGTYQWNSLRQLDNTTFLSGTVCAPDPPTIRHMGTPVNAMDRAREQGVIRATSRAASPTFPLASAPLSGTLHQTHLLSEVRMTVPAPIRAADHLIDQLVAQGSDLIFGVPGESYLPVLDALHGRDNEIRFITCRQEGGAAMAADAHGKLTGRPGICFVTRGPGATNASAGVHVAFQDSTPMILFIGQVARDMVEREAFQEIDYRRMFGQMAKWVAQIDDAARLQEYITRAYRVAMSGRPGPVVLALPEDMLYDMLTPPPAPARIAPPRYLPAPDQMAALRERIARAERPLIMAGGGGWTPQAIAALDTFARAQALPVAVSFRSQGLIDNDHPCYMGHFSTGQPPC